MTRRPREEEIAQYFDASIDCCAPRRDPTKRPGVKLARRAFRAYVHDERLVDAALQAAGFRLSGRSSRLGWFAAVYRIEAADRQPNR